MKYLVIFFIFIVGCATIEIEHTKDNALKILKAHGCAYNIEEHGFCCKDIVPQESLWVMNCEYGVCL